MFPSKIIALTLCVAVTSGCSTLTPSVTRTDTAALTATQVAPGQRDAQMLKQTAALEAATRDLVRKSTVQGAAIGAVAGCGLAAVTGAGKNQCLGGALAGGVVGAVVGNARGKAQVEKRVEIVSLSRVMPSLRDADAQMSLVGQNLPQMLAAQDAEIAALDSQLATGQITRAAHAARVGEIREVRETIAASLDLSAEQAREAHNALKGADAQGQDGLAWYLFKAQKLEKQAVSARGAISLL
ncbi:hypothetical protein [Tropicibacter naphthalenivorans]|uniref:Glycine zipper domain-containing protein n=1 Tax=Tropicibacter naphthalenivorans TaxID=441103 RepID=A0A0P1GDH9_9RHOB|nr:hypothetical protein [Tropicibacter naphthalenivorans]CUH79520.1 hypothetical protein TRN7648_02515 [Tropicibacter naphthalenivorans]SMC73301.1 hypothetical protein SAMN04488093_103144 [Tropicibacter naphthalenivorans]